MNWFAIIVAVIASAFSGYCADRKMYGTSVVAGLNAIGFFMAGFAG